MAIDLPFRRLCLQIPAAGGRLFEGNDEKILKLPFGKGESSC